ncbi:MAG: hypothetical protein EKK64_03450 [Neisseriaceae bacterium]|nr:MAG: hypothetical protein EKK64_03450 [Neisseriaceae bacterium]
MQATTQNTLFIPEKIKVGYQNRRDTYNGKLAYVIYYDKKGVLRKETSWTSWRDKKIEAQDFENEPTEGFVLNKKAGGGSYGWHARNSWIRVYDPRGFEFEISVSNLMFILENNDCSKGKGLEGKFVYSWCGGDLVLLPVNSPDYKSSSEFTDLKTKSIKKKDLKVGFSYKTKKTENCIFLGEMNKNRLNYEKIFGNVLVFLNTDTKEYLYFKDVSKIAVCCSEAPVENYQELVSDYMSSKNYKKPVGFLIKKISRTKLKQSIMSKVINDNLYLGWAENRFHGKEEFKEYIEERLCKEFLVEAKNVDGDFYLVVWRKEKKSWEKDIFKFELSDAIVSKLRFDNSYKIPRKTYDYTAWRQVDVPIDQVQAKMDLILQKSNKEDVNEDACTCLYLKYNDGSEEDILSCFTEEEDQKVFNKIKKEIANV